MRSVRALLYAALGALFLLHQDLWWWDDASLVLGLPVGLVYHVALCFAVTLVMALVVRFAWPSLEAPPGADPAPEERQDGESVP